jgi:hypothetical protein
MTSATVPRVERCTLLHMDVHTCFRCMWEFDHELHLVSIMHSARTRSRLVARGNRLVRFGVDRANGTCMQRERARERERERERVCVYGCAINALYEIEGFQKSEDVFHTSSPSYALTPRFSKILAVARYARHPPTSLQNRKRRVARMCRLAERWWCSAPAHATRFESEPANNYCRCSQN